MQFDPRRLSDLKEVAESVVRIKRDLIVRNHLLGQKKGENARYYSEAPVRIQQTRINKNNWNRYMNNNNKKIPEKKKEIRHCPNREEDNPEN